MLSFFSRNLSDAQRQRRKQRAARLSIGLAVVAALASTCDALSSPGKPLRPVIVLQIVATWLGVLVAALVIPFLQRRRQRKSLLCGAADKSAP